MSTHPLLPAAFTSLDSGDGLPMAGGRYSGAVDDVSTAVWDGGRGLLSRRRLQRKAWLYFGAFSERFLIGYAIADVGLVATAFVYVHDRERNTLVEEKRTIPLGFARDFAPHWRGPWHLARGGRSWSVVREDAGVWRAEYAGDHLQLALRVVDDGCGLSAQCAVPGRPFHYTLKACALTADVALALDGASFQLSAGATMDFSLGYPPRNTRWNWMSLDGEAEDGRRFGLNLVADFLDGSENAMWLGGALVPLSQARFDYSPDDLMAPWRVCTDDSAVDIVFTPEARRSEQQNLGLLASRFCQPCGRFEGSVRADGRVLRVHGLGVVEEHATRW